MLYYIYEFLLRSKSPKQLIIQYTDHCNANCPQCGMNKNNKFNRKKLDKESVKKIIEKAAEWKFKALSFTGGEPLLFEDEIIELINFAYSKKIKYIRTGTNGFIFLDHNSPSYTDKIKRLAERLYNAGIYTFWISIDSCDTETHENMRGLKGVIEGIEKALPVFHKNGVFPAANLGLNRNIGGYNEYYYNDNIPPDEFYNYFKESIDRFYKKIIEMGFTITNTCYPMSIESESNVSYKATSIDKVVKFTREEKKLIYKALFENILKYRNQIKIFTPLSSLYLLIQELEGKSIFKCRGGIDYFFLSVEDTKLYPCGYRAFDVLGSFEKIDFNEFNNKAWCDMCEWECFRDPSNLFAFATDKINFLKKIIIDREYLRLFLKDITYYFKNDLFSGRLKEIKTENL